ncbi:hypothetical protein [Plesiocystis pacifica]|uniref:hypothetical protein n=1 Tax=Plesiocystis pacifica TaxID=191768 RepID=UPI0012F93581|nr:hypothetical protein [Plesiocystis pacifica]
MNPRTLCVLALLCACAPVPALAPESPADPAPAEPEAEPESQTSPQPEPDPSPDAGARSEACQHHLATLAEELCGDEAECIAELEIDCGHTLDLDGDGRDDRAVLALDPDSGGLTIEVQFATGATEVIGATPTPMTEAPDIGQPMPPPSDALPPDLSWMAAWDVARWTQTEDGQTTLVRGRLGHASGPALGDGLWVSGTDAAAMLVYTKTGFLLIQLGY